MPAMQQLLGVASSEHCKVSSGTKYCYEAAANLLLAGAAVWSAKTQAAFVIIAGYKVKHGTCMLTRCQCTFGKLIVPHTACGMHVK